MISASGQLDDAAKITDEAVVYQATIVFAVAV